ncbi:helix-turn-helix domain-containing protein [Pectinatus frisingensis]|uniref:helix-turn-helix domain-containing protein n=1 Tax=Pectinatus frisingensis TaxID=865 RepID=UPI0018C4D67C
MSFGEKLKQCRKDAGLTQAQLGRELNLAESTISLYESNKRSPDNVTLSKIAKLLNVSTDYLLSNSEVDKTIKNKPKDLVKFLDQAEVMFDGDTYKLNADDREKIRAALKLAFYDAKKRNKRKKN